MLDDGWGSPQSCSNIGKLEHATTYYNFITLKILETMLYNVSFAQTTGISKHGGGDFYDQPVWVVSWFWNYWFWNWFGTGFGVGLEINHWFFSTFFHISIFPPLVFSTFFSGLKSGMDGVISPCSQNSQ